LSAFAGFFCLFFELFLKAFQKNGGEEKNTAPGIRRVDQNLRNRVFERDDVAVIAKADFRRFPAVS
jgi:hypothetical protein